MMRSVYVKTLYDKRWFVFGWTLGFVVFAALLTSFYPAFHQDGAFDAFTKNLPKAFEGLIGNLADLKDFPSYIASQLFDIRLPLIAGIMAIILGLGLSTAEEESGELRTLSALPIGRTRLLLQKWLALCTITLVTTLGLIVGIYAVMPFIGNASLEFSVLIRLIGMTWLLMVAYGSVTFAAGMAIGKRAPANAIGIVVIMGSFILSTFGSSVDWLEKFETLSLLHYFPAVDIANGRGNAGDVIVLLSVIFIVQILAVIRFRSRDIG